MPRCIAAPTQHVGVAMQQLSAKVFKLSFEYLHIYSPKGGDFAGKKKQNCIVNVLSKVSLYYEKH